jgi:hypothetical protein
MAHLWCIHSCCFKPFKLRWPQFSGTFHSSPSNCCTERYYGISSAKGYGNRSGNMYSGLKVLTTSAWASISLLLCT